MIDEFKIIVVYYLSTDKVQRYDGGLAQLGERLPYKQRVSGSSPLTSTMLPT